MVFPQPHSLRVVGRHSPSFFKDNNLSVYIFSSLGQLFFQKNWWYLFFFFPPFLCSQVLNWKKIMENIFQKTAFWIENIFYSPLGQRPCRCLSLAKVSICVINPRQALGPDANCPQNCSPRFNNPPPPKKTTNNRFQKLYLYFGQPGGALFYPDSKAGI